MPAFLTFYLQDAICEHSNRIQIIVIVIHGNLIHISGNVTQSLITYLVSMDQKLIHHHRRFITMEETINANSIYCPDPFDKVLNYPPTVNPGNYKQSLWFGMVGH